MKKASFLIAIDDVTGLVLATSRRGDRSQWGLPGGKVDPGESSRGAAVRETREETGYVFGPARLKFAYRGVDDRGDGHIYMVDAWFVRVRRKPRRVSRRGADEAITYAWVDPARLLNEKTSPFWEYNVEAFEGASLKGLL